MIVAWPKSHIAQFAEHWVRQAFSICPSKIAGSRQPVWPFTPLSGFAYHQLRVLLLLILLLHLRLTMFVFSKSVVECSIQVAPSRIPARIPSSPEKAAITCWGAGNAVMTTSALIAASSQCQPKQHQPAYELIWNIFIPAISNSVGSTPWRTVARYGCTKLSNAHDSNGWPRRGAATGCGRESAPSA